MKCESQTAILAPTGAAEPQGTQWLLSSQCRSCGAGSSYIWLLGLRWLPCYSGQMMMTQTHCMIELFCFAEHTGLEFISNIGVTFYQCFQCLVAALRFHLPRKEKPLTDFYPRLFGQFWGQQEFFFLIENENHLRYWVRSGPGIQCRILCVSVYSYIVCWVSGLYSYTYSIQ